MFILPFSGHGSKIKYIKKDGPSAKTRPAFLTLKANPESVSSSPESLSSITPVHCHS